MSFNDPQILDLLSQLLFQLASQDNKIRSEAEVQLDNHWVINQPGHLVVGLAHLAASHPDTYLRSFSSILLRRYALKQLGNGATLLEQAGPEALQQIQALLIQALGHEQEISVRNKVADCASQIAQLLLIKKASWEALFQTCVEFLNSPNPVLRRTTFMILNGCPQLMVKQDQNTVKSMFVAGVQDADMDVRFIALKASVQYCKPAALMV
ncbi:hypothetical protein HDU91_005879 [Kappamyces sp. JEL0680]|nr:hypothetical protein HDU91_005879 [Kappamyces sp. JEL0680]